jgi:hypothetical protein
MLAAVHANSHKRKKEVRPRLTGPFRFTPDNRARFLRVRRVELLARIAGEPSPIQQELIENIACLEWSAKLAEKTAEVFPRFC